MTAPTLPASVLDLRSVVPEVMGLDPWPTGWDPEQEEPYAVAPAWWSDRAPASEPVVPLSVPAARLAVLVAVARVLDLDGEDPVLGPDKEIDGAWWLSLRNSALLPVGFHVPGVSSYTEALHAIALAVEARR